MPREDFLSGREPWRGGNRQIFSKAFLLQGAQMSDAGNLKIEDLMEFATGTVRGAGDVALKYYGKGQSQNQVR